MFPLPLSALVHWCRSLHHGIGAGLDVRRLFKQQAKSGPRPLRAIAADVAAKLDTGEALADALEPYRNRFPPLFLELVSVGEQTGRLEDTFRELEHYYESSLSVQRNFRAQMVYPAIQYTIAVLVIGTLIWILGILGESGRALTTDPTGLGFTGAKGAITFMAIAFGFVGGIIFLVSVAKNNTRWREWLEGIMLIVPVWGPALRVFAIQRFAVALRMCTEAGLRPNKTLHYSFRATANAMFTRGEAAAVEVVKRGGEITKALMASGAPFTIEFREMVQMGEETGNLTEVMERVARNLREEGERRLRTAAQMTGWAIYLLVAIMIIIAIFKLASIYLGAIDGALKGV
jgi:type IV pilus assembly protein PilC